MLHSPKERRHRILEHIPAYNVNGLKGWFLSIQTQDTKKPHKPRCGSSVRAPEQNKISRNMPVHNRIVA